MAIPSRHTLPSPRPFRPESGVVVALHHSDSDSDSESDSDSYFWSLQ